MKKFIISLLLLSLYYPATSQNDNSQSLNLVASSPQVQWPVFDLDIPNAQERKILNSYGKKTQIKDFKWFLNGQDLKVTSCKTRGNNTLKFRRKSFQLNFGDPLVFAGTPMDQVAINNLAMDKNYWRNRLAFILLQRLDLFPITNFYCEIRINGNTQGLFLLIHKPESYARDILRSPIVLRKGMNSSYKLDHDEYGEGKIKIKSLRGINKLCKQYKGDALSDSLNMIFDLQQYYQWLAFNFIIMNGDYTDELFLYLETETGQFHIIPWDYDDIFAVAPHEGWAERDLKLSNNLIFSGEYPLDVSIDRDPVLYADYLAAFDGVMAVLSTSELKDAFEQVYDELQGMLQVDSIILQSTYDQEGPTSLEKLTKDLNYHYKFLTERMVTLRALLEQERVSFSR